MQDKSLMEGANLAADQAHNAWQEDRTTITFMPGEAQNCMVFREVWYDIESNGNVVYHQPDRWTWDMNLWTFANDGRLIHLKVYPPKNIRKLGAARRIICIYTCIIQTHPNYHGLISGLTIKFVDSSVYPSNVVTNAKHRLLNLG